MRIDAVFSGGGVKAFAYLGVLESFNKNHIQFERVAGTSAGAIVASLIAAGFDYEAIEKTIETIDLQEFIDPPIMTKYLPFTKWLYLYFHMGMYRGEKLENWLANKLAEKQIHTFSDLRTDYLKIVVSDITSGRLVVLPDDLEEYYGISPQTFSVAQAVRMSAGFPFFFMPAKMISPKTGKHLIVDGGLLSNFPLWIFNQKQSALRPVLGVQLTEKTSDQNGDQKLTNSFQLTQALISTMKKAHDMRYVSRADEKDILFIPVDPIKAVNFSVSQTEKDKLIETGRKHADIFLKSWPR